MGDGGLTSGLALGLTSAKYSPEDHKYFYGKKCFHPKLLNKTEFHDVVVTIFIFAICEKDKEII